MIEDSKKDEDVKNSFEDIGEMTDITNKYVRRSDEAVKDLAMRIYRGEIFPSWNIPERDKHMLTMIFIPLMFLDSLKLKEFKRDNICYFYGDMSECGPRAVNGYPVFMSVGVLDQEDAKRIIDKLKSIEKMMEGI